VLMISGGGIRIRETPYTVDGRRKKKERLEFAKDGIHFASAAGMTPALLGPTGAKTVGHVLITTTLGRRQRSRTKGRRALDVRLISRLSPTPPNDPAVGLHKPGHPASRRNIFTPEIPTSQKPAHAIAGSGSF